MGPPDHSEAEEFLESVNEVSRLIDGLKAGTITPDYIDRNHTKRLPKPEPKALDAIKASKPISKGPSPAGKQSEDDTENDTKQKEQEDEEAKRERLMEKARELQANRDRKLKARQCYDEYVKSMQDQPHASTDYQKWAMWCPEDEEDDLFNSLTPNNPAFRALEKDIDDRHKRMVEQRQIAERQRVAGNEAFKTGQWSEALRCYQLGLESEKTNMTLHANAAQAALKVNCFVQAIEHCDKVLNIADFLHNNTKQPLCAKAYMRRAMAYRSLGQFERAVRDVAAALEILPEDKELLQLKSKADLDLNEHIKQKELNKALKKVEGTGSGSTTAVTLDIDKLGRVERFVCQIKEEPNKAFATQQSTSAEGDATTGAAEAAADAPQAAAAAAAPMGVHTQAKLGGSHGPQLPPPRKGKAQAGAGKQQAEQAGLCPAAQLELLLRGDDQCCVYFRECGGIAAVAQCVLAAQESLSTPSSTPSGSAPPPTPTTPPPPGAATCATNLSSHLILLNTAAANDGNLLQLPQQKGLLPAILNAACRLQDLSIATAAASLLCTLSTRDDVRKLISTTFTTSTTTMPAILKTLQAAPDTLRGLLLLLLGNCCIDKPCKAALSKVLSKEDAAKGLVAVVAASLSPKADEGVAERALALVGNMCGGEELRQVLSSRATLVSAVASKVIAGAGGGEVKARASASLPASCVAAATALYNLTVDSVAQQAVGSSGHLPALFKLLSHSDSLLVARLAGVVARCAKQASVQEALLNLNGIPVLVALVTSLLDKMSVKGSEDATVSALDAAVRAITVLVSTTESEDPAVRLLSTPGGGACLHRVVASPMVNQAIVGNAALCVGSLAKHAALLPDLGAMCAKAKSKVGEDAQVEGGGVPSQGDADACLMAALVRAAYQGQGTVVAKNAGIALARLATHTPLLERLRELRGLEIIHATVKKL